MTCEAEHDLPEQEPAKPAHLVSGTAQWPPHDYTADCHMGGGSGPGPHAVLPVFPDPYLTGHETKPMGFLGLCSLISRMSVLQLEMKPLPRLTMPDTVLGSQKHPSEGPREGGCGL